MNRKQNVRPIVTSMRGKRSGLRSTTRVSRSGIKDIVVQSEAWVLTRVYVIRLHMEASVLDDIVGTFSTSDVTMYALIYTRSTHSYIYEQS